MVVAGKVGVVVDMKVGVVDMVEEHEAGEEAVATVGGEEVVMVVETWEGEVMVEVQTWEGEVMVVVQTWEGVVMVVETWEGEVMVAVETWEGVVMVAVQTWEEAVMVVVRICNKNRLVTMTTEYLLRAAVSSVFLC